MESDEVVEIGYARERRPKWTRWWTNNLQRFLLGSNLVLSVPSYLHVRSDWTLRYQKVGAYSEELLEVEDIINLHIQET